MNPSSYTISHVALVLALVMIFAKVAGELASRLKQPPVLGELIAGIVIGNVPLHVTRGLGTDPAVDLLAQLGVLLLLFEVGLESTVRELLAVGAAAVRVALLGTLATFAAGTLLARVVLPGAGSFTHVFLGASITATSIGITARVFKDLDRTTTGEARTILGAAVLDDVLGLLVLALVAGWIRNAREGESTSIQSLVWLMTKTVLVLAGAIAIGVRVTPRIFAAAARLRTPGTLLTVGLSFCFLFAWGAEKLGLAPIIGAFAAGLILEKLHSEGFVQRGERSLADLLEPISSFLVPIFFVVMGVRADLSAFTHTSTLALAGVLLVAAIVGKLACGLGTSRGVSRLSVAIGMMPRGEVTLIFASLGVSLGVIDRAAYSALVLVVLATTVITPTALKWSLK